MAAPKVAKLVKETDEDWERLRNPTGRKGERSAYRSNREKIRCSNRMRKRPSSTFNFPTESEVIAYFSAPQGPEVYEHLGTIDTSDELWSVFYNGAGGTHSELPAPDQVAPDA